MRCDCWLKKHVSLLRAAGALPVAAALSGKAGKGPIVAIISGGNIDLQKFCELISQSGY
jgi:threonine dehydratase